jgi:hypothetical protein
MTARAASPTCTSPRHQRVPTLDGSVPRSPSVAPVPSDQVSSAGWTEDRVHRELEAFLPGRETWPSYTEFRRCGRRGLWQAMTHFGGPARFAEEYGLRPQADRPNRTDADIRAALRAALRGTDLTSWPSRRWLVAHGGARLAGAVDRTGGPRRWAPELGLPLRHLRHQQWTPETIAAALEQLLAARRTWPNRREFQAAGLAGLYAAITRTEGHAAMAARFGLPLQRPRRHCAAPPRSRSPTSDSAAQHG